MVQTLVLCSIFTIIGLSSAHAAWVTNGVAVAPSLDPVPGAPQIVSDGSGGAIVVWQNSGGSDKDIYAQRVDANGAILWVADGIVICAAASDQMVPHLIADGSGGAIITWEDYRGGSHDIYAQRVNASGVVQWTTDGVAICLAANSQESSGIVSDGSGGAIITWEDYRGGNYDIYAQRVNASGAVQWTANGAAVCTATNSQSHPAISSDGSGGAVVTWQDYRSGSSNDIYAQRLNASGAVQWTANGVAICTVAYDQTSPEIASDGSGGAIITWQDYRSGGGNDIYAQRVNTSGAVQWTAGGVAICAADDDQAIPEITSDGSGGAIIAWEDYRSGSDNDIYAQLVNASGAVQWTADGVAVCAATDIQDNPALVSDGSGGAIITWQDYRGGSYPDIYAQEISVSGSAQWTADGDSVCTARYSQTFPV
ncbi:MAG: hypothetical protein PHD74_09780, partial [Candidatus Krumholzibacteria bacterium]|nr:hypothetical protein [Candidatus Krumholzibacteria bacterium]